MCRPQASGEFLLGREPAAHTAGSSCVGLRPGGLLKHVLEFGVDGQTGGLVLARPLTGGLHRRQIVCRPPAWGEFMLGR
ncbi:hypothetical protein Poly24_31540 [Rosistilla carotiformis]|uniref:Uncharacterized protein n=1 Tax=Rosistilla carotiformis TaxID=2528017 RepID=A0A518JV86_9BACT|nr:hypothetical protein Poly24_31540 [Rosistilla carotiformis]